jgi:SAM-dependent methyltransferase
MTDDPNLTNAYAVTSKDEVRSLYENWAESYDADFIEAQGYQMPRVIAEVYAAAGGAGPVLDVGAGTGRGGEHLAAAGVHDIDGIDLSQDMLRVAAGTGVYRELICADITQDLGPIGPYAGIVSAGTFTFGHVGPEGLPALMQVAKPGCLFVLGVNAAHFAASGFEAALEHMGGQITGLTMRDVRIYDDRADAEHRMDQARVLVFRTV